mmetsp:Transcript_19472/g.36365  ORF Transcript_19472/g.36365 Transcript_19472/m.36365 type:complete len:1426 (+) Transcript_19472:506-4783(+)|eukprot:CAMPEP_0201634784 /NCGR_PEP_ID=MMETSP0493-20130528/7576_1 /ASSEMBLY_ACC=CAM_ASM_000838 /TAXON_ID=420259 /ORGANISM="Thalassiosira gravida, Strain GMp14c1" /LENGTH=1425 /DNA_ID=CAMNT_0048106669 /DNA_START=507 /DNA_END=4784 /DNA_ORIENTATION=+
MLCEPSQQTNNAFNPWPKRNKKIKNSGACSSSIVSSTSSKQYSSGTKFRTGKLSFKTSGSPEAKSITPEKDNDVEMDEVKGGGATVAAGAGGGDDNSSSDEDVEMGEEDEAMDESEDDNVKKRKGSRQNKSAKKSASDENSDGGAKNNKDGSSKKDSTKPTTKKDKSGEKDEKELAEDGTTSPLLVGTLTYSDRDNLRRHIIRGNWNYENSLPQRFELIRTIPPEENLKELPKDGEFNGSFNVQLEVKSSKGKIKKKNRAVQESGVKLRFTPKDEDDEDEGNSFAVNGTGTNEYGIFELFGTATKNAGDEDPTYNVSVRKKYVPPAEPATKKSGESTKKDRKRKHAEASSASDGEEKPPPTELPTEGICLHGKLVRNTSDELSLDNAAVHRITGVWALEGLSKILDDSESCEKFEYEHKCMGDSTVFPLSGRYTGSFYCIETPGQRTKITERDVVLKFRRNSAGYFNVEGKGANIYGKYTITGTLAKDGTITLFRHFQAPKAKTKTKAKTRPASVKISASANASSGGSNAGKMLPKASAGGTMAVQQASSFLSFDDVNLPKWNEPVHPLSPPEQFTAISRGILKIENDGTHTCSGSWAMTNDHYQSGITSKYHFGVMAANAADDAEIMIERMKSSGVKDDERQIKNMASDGVSPVTLAHSTFPIDSTQYKGNFKLRKGATRTQTIVDQQIVLKYVKNTGGSYNVYGKGVNEMGTFDLVGTLILQGKVKGLMQLYRMYPPPEQAPAVQPSSMRKSAKVFPGSLTEKAGNSGPVPAMEPPGPFVASTSGLLRRESARVGRLPSRLEEDDPQAHMDRLMEKCCQILKELQECDTQQIFASAVDPIALGIPTYFDVIKTPMDLGTIQTKMDHNEIDSPEEFARLVHLTFQNAIQFNSMPDNLVHVTARNLLVIFNKKFGTIDKAFNAAKKNKKLTKAERQELKRKEKEAAKEVKRKAKEEEKRKRKSDVEATNESKRMKLENIVAANKSAMAAIAQAAPKDSDADMTRPEFNLLLQAIKQVQDQIVGLHKLIKKSPVSNAAPSSSSIVDTQVDTDEMASAVHAPSSLASEPKPLSQPAKTKKKKPKKEPEPSPPPSPKTAPPEPPVVEELSYEEKEILSESINLLPDRLLPAAMQIIREADLIDDDDEEIDLDIDQLDTKTQRKLQSFVMQNVKQKKKAKTKKQKQSKSAQAVPTPAPTPASGPSPSPPSPEEEEEEEEEGEEVEDSKPAAISAPPQGGKSLSGGNLFGDDLDDDDDSDDDDKEDDEEDIQFDFTNLGANPSTEDAAEEEKQGGDDSDKDHRDDLWEESRRKAEADKAREADRVKREANMLAEKEKAEKKRMAEARALGEQAKAKRVEQEAAEARRLEEQELEAEKARKAARELALQQLNSVQTTIDTGDAQRDLMKQYEEEFNDTYSAGASPSSDFGF